MTSHEPWIILSKGAIYKFFRFSVVAPRVCVFECCLRQTARLWSGRLWSAQLSTAMGTSGGAAVVAASTATLYAFGSWFLRAVLCAETRDLISYRVGATFAGTFAATSTLSVLVMCEIAGWVDAETLRGCWKGYLRAGTAALLVWTPWELFLLGFKGVFAEASDGDGVGRGGGGGGGRLTTTTTTRQRRMKAHALATLATFVFVWAFLGVHGTHGTKEGAAGGGGGTFTMFRVVSRTGVLGVTLLGILSGFGAVHFPYTTIRVFNRSISDAKVFSLERKLVQSVETIVERKKRAATLKRDIAREASAQRQRGSGGSLFGRLAAGMRLPGVQTGRANQVIALSSEINALEMVNRTLFFELHEVNLQRERAKISTTPYGRFLEICGVLLLITCGYRFLSGFKRLIFKETPRTDPITTALHLFLANKSIHVDPETLSQYLSLIFIAFLVVNSMQNFVFQLTKLFFAVGGGGITTDGLVLFTTEAVGLYFLSSVLLVREQLPESYRHLVTEALGADLEFRFYSKFYDLIFMASAALTAFALYARHVVGVREDDHSYPGGDAKRL